MEWKGVFLDARFSKVAFFSTPYILDDESDEHILNSLCTSLHLVSL
jgi:hypothetical protein